MLIDCYTVYLMQLRCTTCCMATIHTCSMGVGAHESSPWRPKFRLLYWYSWSWIQNVHDYTSFLDVPDPQAPRSSSSIATKTSKLQTSTSRKFMTNDFSLTQRLPLVELDFLNSQHNCDNGFWDPLANRCYNTTCGYHYQFQNGHCLFRNISKTLQCPQKNEFRWWEVW